MIINDSLNLTYSRNLEKEPKIWNAAQSLESNFIAEMFKSAGLGKSRESFGGGAGEDQFSSFLTREYADATVKAGGVGLAESIYQSMIKNQRKF